MSEPPAEQPPERGAGSATFLFADLAGYTALTETHGDEHAADAAEEFCAVVRELVGEYRAQEVKTVGDAVMLRVESASDAIELGLRIIGEVGARHGHPGVRVGMHTGGAVERQGDWFGAAVNLAARVAGLAGDGDVLLTEATRDAAGELLAVGFRERGRQGLKNVSEPVMILAAEELGGRKGRDLPIDPVCRMAVDPERAAGTLVYHGVRYEFCSLKCAGEFAAAPKRFTSAAGVDGNGPNAEGAN